MVISSDRKQTDGCLRRGVRGMAAKGHKGTFWGGGNVPHLGWGVTAWMYTSVRGHHAVRLKGLHCVTCKWCPKLADLNKT